MKYDINRLTDVSILSHFAFLWVLQTLLVYDLVKRSYVRRKTGLYVVPCLQQEYSLLEEGRVLLGLSETR